MKLREGSGKRNIRAIGRVIWKHPKIRGKLTFLSPNYIAFITIYEALFLEGQNLPFKNEMGIKTFYNKDRFKKL